MERPPRSQKEGIFSDGVGFGIIYQGILIAILTLAAYFITSSWYNQEAAMTAAFFTLSMCEIFQAFTLRSLKQSTFSLKTHNIVLWGAMAFSLIATLLVIYVPFLSAMFSLKPLTINELGLSFGLAILIIPIVEVVKAVQRASEKKTV